MSQRQSMNFSIAAALGAGSVLACFAAAQAMTPPAPRPQTPYLQAVDCAVGAHIGPLGGCILGNDDDRRPVVIERRSADTPPPDPANPDGCASRSVTTTDSMGNSQTKTQTNC